MNILMRRIKNSQGFFFKLKHETLKKCTAWGRLLWLCPRPPGSLHTFSSAIRKIFSVNTWEVSWSIWQRQPLQPDEIQFPYFLTESLSNSLPFSEPQSPWWRNNGYCKLVSIWASWPRRTAVSHREATGFCLVKHLNVFIKDIDFDMVNKRGRFRFFF